jgi:uncharacterized protein
MHRYLEQFLQKDVKKKMVILTGPRQVGKTFLSKQLSAIFRKTQYMNYDNQQDAILIDKARWALDADLLIFDELHKKKDWKGFLKGTYDKKTEKQSILVTGSARMDTFRQSGESLAGRYYHYRFHPLSVRELKDDMAPDEALRRLLFFGGFPEPFLSDSEGEANRWRKQYFTDLIREDILEFSRINEIRTMRLLLEMLTKRVGSPLSYRSLAEDIQVAPNTISRYIDILSALYIIFLIRPYHRNIARSIQREPKVYFYDTGMVSGDEGTKLENTAACCLLKHSHFLQDALGQNIELAYIRTKEKKEIDFALVRDEQVTEFIEVKLSNTKPSKELIYFKDKLQEAKAVQIVMNLRDPMYYYDTDIHVEKAADYFAGLSV